VGNRSRSFPSAFHKLDGFPGGFHRPVKGFRSKRPPGTASFVLDVLWEAIDFPQMWKVVWTKKERACRWGSAQKRSWNLRRWMRQRHAVMRCGARKGCLWTVLGRTGTLWKDGEHEDLLRAACI